MNEKKASAMKKIFIGLIVKILPFGTTIPYAEIIGGIFIIVGLVQFLKVVSSKNTKIALVAISCSLVFSLVMGIVANSISGTIDSNELLSYIEAGDINELLNFISESLKDVMPIQIIDSIGSAALSVLFIIYLAKEVKDEGAQGNKMYKDGLYASIFLGVTTVVSIIMYCSMLNLTVATASILVLASFALIGCSITYLVFYIKYIVDANNVSDYLAVNRSDEDRANDENYQNAVNENKDENN